MRKNSKVTRETNNVNRELERKKRILTSAIKTFGERGFQDATISEIAKDAGVGDATIYEDFKNKEDLLLAIPVEMTPEIITQINDHMIGIKGAANKLRKFVWWWMNYIEKNPGYGSIVLLELKTRKNFVYAEGYQSARAFYKIVLDIINEGKEQGIFKEEVNPYLARSICIGAIEHIVIRWLIKDRKYSLTQYTDELVDLLIDSFKKKEFNPEKILMELKGKGDKVPSPSPMPPLLLSPLFWKA